MRRKIPSTAALAAFEAAARHQSFTLAADELAVTQSAVCRQIAGLEDFVGVPLFRRTRRGVALTTAGQDYARRVRQRLDEVERDTLALMGTAGSAARDGLRGSLELGIVPTFGTHWLLPRLPGFAAEHPGITVHLSSRVRPFLFEGSGLDATVFAGEGGWPGTEAHALMPEQLFAVGSPALLGGRTALDQQDWLRTPLLQMSTRPYVWRQWFSAQGLSVPGDMAGPRLELFTMLSKAAAHGLGAALMPRLLVEDELQRGLLVALSPAEIPSNRHYFLIHPPEAEGPTPSPLAVFRQWLLAQARTASYAGPR
jgi:LysR family glycine cleavage system transcriptional activator